MWAWSVPHRPLKRFSSVQHLRGLADHQWEIDAEHWRTTIEINLTGAFHTAKAAIPTMIEQATGGSITFTSSVAGLVGLPMLAGYVAAKHGVTGLSKTLANELAPYRIRVNSVHPFGVETGLQMTEPHPVLGSDPALGTLYLPSLPDGISHADDIAAAVAWIASDEARYGPLGVDPAGQGHDGRCGA